MYDASADLRRFYDTHVRLGASLRNDLAGYRDLNLERLTSGLAALSEKRGTTYPTYAECRNQGSYAMHTLNQCAHTDYDIDVAVIFDQASLPDDAKAARELVRDALLEKCSNFTKEPEARANAVTVWYADGYHVDFAVYRKTVDWFGNTTIEHAGADGWATREPTAYTDWFSERVTSRSPPTLWDTVSGTQVHVDNGQLRRIVRLAKAFARSRSGWALPGGVVITTLVTEVFERDCARDDIAFVKTFRALHNRLLMALEVDGPIPPGASLVGTDKRKKEMERLRDCLETTLDSLDVLSEFACTDRQARTAWNAVFNHSFWTEEISESKRAEAMSNGLAIECWLAKKEEGPVYASHRSNSSPLPKRVALRFSVNPVGVQAPYEVRWAVRNEGDEATAAKQLTWDKTLAPGAHVWTSTAYKGTHYMDCEVVKNGLVVQSGRHIVRIGSRR